MAELVSLVENHAKHECLSLLLYLATHLKPYSKLKTRNRCIFPLGQFGEEKEV